jgi:UDP-xylose/UDP-N-acetylglucosamine transporter B4
MHFLTPTFQFSVVIVTLGVVLVTLSRTAASSTDEIPKVMNQADLRRYFTGIGMMTVSLFCTGTLGLLQERTYREYGPCWREGVFYTVCCGFMDSFILY